MLRNMVFSIMNQELVFNFWAIYDAGTCLVYSLAGKAYNLSGSDAEKLALLKKLSATDYITAKRYKLPDRFQVSYTDGTEKKGVTFLNTVHDPNAQLFEEMFRNLEPELPPLPDLSGSDYKEIKQKIPDDPLCVVTVLYEDETGSIRPIITDEDRQWISQQEQMMPQKKWPRRPL
jgi:hypothetical protein